MDDSPDSLLKKLCCTCLCKDRKLYQLCRLNDGINSLYSLLSYDTEAYREGFYKDTASLFICWECKAVMCKIVRFRRQACKAQKQLACLTDGRTDIKSLNTCLSRLSTIHKNEFDHNVTSEIVTDVLTDNFIDCGPVVNIKTEGDDLEDVPLSELHDNCISDSELDAQEQNITMTKETKTDIQIKPLFEKRKSRKRLHSGSDIKLDSFKKKKKTKIKSTKKYSFIEDSNKTYFTTTQMSESEMSESIENRKLSIAYADAAFKCESCILVFKAQIDLDTHSLSAHTQKEKHTQCDLCLVYIRNSLLHQHRTEHYMRYCCNFCDYISYDMRDTLKHLKSGHAMQNLIVPVERKKGHRKTPEVLKPGSKPRRNQAMMDKRTPFGYLCTECNKYFDNKNQRWKHVQRYHREGFKCATCGKRFAFKNNLTRHEQLHQGPPPREECPECHKMIRVDLLKIHSRIHTHRERFSCAECEKCFVSRASYEHHLKYTQAHAAVDILKYKCSMCDKGYRSRGELRDHVNYQHMGKTQHKCPICGKALATRRCITRHVRRAHDGVKESARDKICQQCGKAFRDKKGLREHEFIHTGERPLSCEICGCTFRQSASLYTHRKRVHKIYPQKKNVQLLEGSSVAVVGGDNS